MTPYGSRSLGGLSSFGATTTNLSGEVENGISRLQRSSTSIESKLDDLQSKMDRLMNMQGSLKPSKFSANSGLFSNSSSGLVSSSSSVGGGSTTSSSSLIKNLEKALNQRDQLQEFNARLQDSLGQLESTVEDLQSQQESLQLENRNLLDKLQNGNQLQQDKFRLELRNLQQQLSHTQEQMLMYQEENFHLRNELGAKDEQLVKEKARLQDDARKQLEQLQRQLQEQVQHDSQDALSKATSEKKALESQLADAAVQKQAWQEERESLLSQLRQAQTQHQQIQNEKARSQADQDSRVRELEMQLQQALSESKTAKLQADRYLGESQHLEELLVTKEQEMAHMQTDKNEQEYAALSELFKEFMNDIYFHFQDAFDEDAEFTGKEIVMAIRKILKQNTMDILSRLEEFWQLQGHDSGHH
jgi:chromosome segregation ATPase